ncbi:MAG: biotin--[acetyl-CoA-carboxylase] ligase [Chloroflexi bacterium]|nr:biotin--[acetyl-CoA-carboxylase] ligase [Chloroflexota bacterium]
MRESVLRALQETRCVSGQELGEKLRISRTAVWKYVNELRRLGYQIDSSPRRGYSLTRSADLLLPEEVGAGLETRFLGKRILHHAEVTSTQDIAEELARAGAEEGLVVIAEGQTRGRGRKGRGWESPAGGGVYLSIVLRPDLIPSLLIQIPLIAGVAVVRAVRQAAPLEPALNWPNNIIIGGRKAGGVLTEMSCEIDGVNYIVLGIGVNINTPMSLIPEPTRGIATSLAAECGRHVSRVKFVQKLLSEFETLYSEFLKSGFARIREEWKSANCTLGGRVRVTDGEDEIEGEALDIDREGFLLVRKENGDVRRIITGDVTLCA